MTSRRNGEIRILPVFPACLVNNRAKVRRRTALLATSVLERHRQREIPIPAAEEGGIIVAQP
jgi:hypothetical protein